MRRHLILVGLILIPAAFAWSIIQKERVLSDGQNVLLKLAPVDPRSLMQGDYMTLRYAIARELSEQLSQADQSQNADGMLVLAVDGQGVGTLVRFDQAGTQLADGEMRLQYKRRKGSIRLGAESFFFQEGTAEVFDEARYGELRVAEDGSSVLVGLRDSSLRVLGAEQRLH